MTATIVAYQLKYGTTGWTPPTGGALTPQLVNQVAPYFGSGNWAPLMWSNYSQMWYWQYMNHSNPGATVFHKPFKWSPRSNYGIQTSSFNTTIYAVYVPPATPLPVPAPKPLPPSPGYWYYFWKALGY